jgi:hypothetical protein
MLVQAKIVRLYLKNNLGKRAAEHGSSGKVPASKHEALSSKPQYHPLIAK